MLTDILFNAWCATHKLSTEAISIIASVRDAAKYHDSGHRIMKALLLTLLLTLSLAGVAQAQTRHYIPNSRLTPGDALKVTADDLCKPGHAEIEGNISVQLKSQVFDRYGIRGDLIGYKVEHLIPPELGGSNSLKNLWPQPLAGEWTYHMKNRLERRLGKLVCNGALDLKIAQQEIAADWIGAYKKYLSAPGQVRSNRRRQLGLTKAIKRAALPS
ncbi:MAG TPA: hypothetical protein VN937_11750 [Blastocatellia bacterium]|nr:hypothetical protein [Blastocatellia bacterium]